MRIRVNPNDLRALGRELQRVSDELQRLSQRVGSAAAGLDWEARQRLGVEGRAADARNRARALAEQAAAMSRSLVARAQAFEEADAHGAREMGIIVDKMPLPVPRWIFPLPRLPWPFPRRWPIIRLPILPPRFPRIVWPIIRVPEWRWSKWGMLVGPVLDWGSVPPWFRDRLMRILPLPIGEVVPPAQSTPSIRLPDGREVPLAELYKQYPLGRPPVSALTETRRQYPVNGEVTSSPDLRQQELYDAVINQFGVETNPRYTGPETYCNIFVSDVTRAMGVEIPHWVDKDGRAVQFSGTAEPGWRELNVQGMRTWLQGEGSSKWRAVSAEEAQRLANSGKPTVVLDGRGTHIGVVRPGEIDSQKGPALAQAGKDNFGSGNVLDGFGAVESDYGNLQYYVAD